MAGSGGLTAVVIAVVLEARYQIMCDAYRGLDLIPWSREQFALGLSSNVELAMSEYR